MCCLPHMSYNNYCPSNKPSCSQLGVHIDGFCAMAAHTAIIGCDDSRPVVGPAADVIAAAHAAALVAVRLVKPGNKNTIVAEAIKRVAEVYGVTPLTGVLSHNLKRFVVDGKIASPFFFHLPPRHYRSHTFTYDEQVIALYFSEKIPKLELRNSHSKRTKPMLLT
jgi:methionine aminopeptidase